MHPGGKAGSCTLYDIGQQADYLVMEYLEGETLAARLTEGPLPTEVRYMLIERGV